MIPTFVPQITAQATADSHPRLDSLLPPGQTRTARVQLLEPLAGRPGSYRLQLLLGSRLLALEVDHPISPGSNIRIQRDSSGQVGISVPSAGTATNADQAAARPHTPVTGDSPGKTSAPMDSALREALPRQQPVADLLGQLSAVRMPPSAAGQQIEQLILALVQLFSLRPGQRDGARAVRRNVEQGGFFSEAGLAAALKQGQTPATEMKTLLGQLLRLAEQLPPEARERMQSLVDSLLARVTTRQLISAAHSRDLPDGSGERQFALDLPVRVGERHENVTLEVRRHRPAASVEAAEGYWCIRLHFDLDELGPLDAELYLGDNGRLNARFWTREVTTVQLIETRLAQLSAALERQGLNVDGLHCRQGKMPPGKMTIQRQLIDLRT